MLPERGWPTIGRQVLYEDDTGQLWPGIITRTKASTANTATARTNELRDNDAIDVMVFGMNDDHTVIHGCRMGTGAGTWGWPEMTTNVDPAGPQPPRKMLDLTSPTDQTEATRQEART